MFSRLYLCFTLIGVAFGCGKDESSPTMMEIGNTDCRTEVGKCTDGFICQMADSGAYECVPESNPMGGEYNNPMSGGEEGGTDPVDPTGSLTVLYLFLFP